MTKEEITKLKMRVCRYLAERVSEGFLGHSIAEVSAEVVKSYFDRVLQDLRRTEKLNPVVELMDWNVRFEGNVMHAVMEPKKGLDDYNHRRAVNFLFNQGDD